MSAFEEIPAEFLQTISFGFASVLTIEEQKMEIEIKKCEWNDNSIAAVIELSRKWESEDATFGYCANDQNDLIGNDLFAAYLGDEMIGYLFGKCIVLQEAITPIEKGKTCFEIGEIYVKEDYRSKGIGRALFELAESNYKQKVQYITLSTATKNYKSVLHFYIEKMDMTFWSAKLFKEIK